MKKKFVPRPDPVSSTSRPGCRLDLLGGASAYHRNLETVKISQATSGKLIRTKSAARLAGSHCSVWLYFNAASKTALFHS